MSRLSTRPVECLNERFKKALSITKIYTKSRRDLLQILTLPIKNAIIWQMNSAA